MVIKHGLNDESARSTVCLSFQSSSQSQLIKQTIESKSSRVTIPSTELHPGSVYIFILTVHKMGRTPTSVNQTVSIITTVWIRIVENGRNGCLWFHDGCSWIIDFTTLISMLNDHFSLVSRSVFHWCLIMLFSGILTN